MQPRFEAVYSPSTSAHYAEWLVIEWIYSENGNRVARVIARYGDCRGAQAREEAGILQQAYNREFYENFG